MKSRYWGPFRQEWYSICSAHMSQPTEGCDLCATGMWHNVLLTRIGSYFHNNHYKLWFWWANRRYFNKSRRFLEKTFPKLRRKP